MDLNTNEISVINHFGMDDKDTILGLCWLKSHPNLYLSGSSRGRVCCGDIARKDAIVHEYETFEKLTSVHVNRTNSSLLVSGYSTTVGLYDIETGATVRLYKDIHKDHINISRFTNNSPHIFGTSSFDSTIKLWDLRQRTVNTDGTAPVDPGNHISTTNQGQLYTLKCNSGVVMINFSADDTFLLASAQDNEINQFILLHGGLHSKFDLVKTGLTGNFTRAYYSASGRHTITGACEQSTVKLLCTYTGSYLTSVPMAPIMRDPSIYIQSLRGSPRDDFRMCVLTNYRDVAYRELVHVHALPPLDSDLLPEPAEVDAQELLKGTRTLHVAIPSYRFLDQMYGLRKVAASASSRGIPEHSDLGLGDARHDLVYMTYGSNSREVLAVHGFILVARGCGLLELVQRQLISGLPAVADLASTLTANEWQLAPLLLDYLYLGLAALELCTFRKFAMLGLLQAEQAQLLRKYQHKLPARPEEDFLPLSFAAHWGRVEKVILFDEGIWRADDLLIDKLLQTLFAFHQLGQKLGLGQCCAHVVWLLSTIVLPSSVLQIWSWAGQQHLPELGDGCVKFLAAHWDVVPGLHGPNNGLFVSEAEQESLQNDVMRVDEDNCLEVVTREQFLVRLEQLTHWFETHPSPSDEAVIRQLRCTWKKEESPLLPAVGHFSAATCLSNFMWHAACQVMDKSLIFIGGMNRDRLNSFSHLLVYDAEDDHFRYVHCTGTEVPASAYMHCCVPLQKHHTTNIAVLGGKIKAGEVGSKSPPQYRNIIWDGAQEEIKQGSAKLAKAAADAEDALYELDYGKLTWHRRKVTMVNTVRPVTRFATHDTVQQEAKDLSTAFKQRIAQSVVPIHWEDMPYRCARCLFQSKSNMNRCTHDKDTADMQITWAIQFGGYCPVSEHAKSDLHVLTCRPTETQDYQYEWTMIEALGDAPPERFSHSAVFVPDAGIRRYARMLVMGGVAPHVHNFAEPADVKSLRINHNHEDRGDVRWEVVAASGTSPPKLHGHAMSHIPGTNTCIVTGGIMSTNAARDSVVDKVWCMSFHESAAGEPTNLQVTWSTVTYQGIAPSPRSRHTSNVLNIDVNDRPCDVLFVFGGLDETRDGDDELQQQETKPRDCVMHCLGIKNSEYGWLDRSMDSTVLWLDAQPTVQAPACTLGMDMRHLVSVDPAEPIGREKNPFKPDLTISFGAEAVVRVFATLVAQRSPMLRALLSTDMIESQTGIVRMPEGPPMHAMRQLMEYLCSDYLSLSSVQQTADILELGNQHDLVELIKICEGSLLRLVDSSTVYELLGYAERYSLELLRASCYSHLLGSNEEMLQDLLEDKDAEGDRMEEEEDTHSAQLSQEAIAAFRSFARDSTHVYKMSVPSAGDAL